MIYVIYAFIEWNMQLPYVGDENWKLYSPYGHAVFMHFCTQAHVGLMKVKYILMKLELFTHTATKTY